MLAAALDYAQRCNWPVLPLAWITDKGVCSCMGREGCKPAKHPLILKGVNGASTDPDKIKRWWAMWPQANIGIRTGRESGLLVLDVDPRNGGDRSLAQLQSLNGNLPYTLVVKTGGGGGHFYFRYPGPIRLKGKLSEFPGLDIKADGGYVVAPPSRHVSGGVYHWQRDWLTAGIAPVPEWLLELIRAEAKTERRNLKGGNRTRPAPNLVTMELRPEDWEIVNRLAAGMEGSRYRLLYDGEWKALDYNSQSEADLALFNKLARLVDGDPGRMFAIFKETGLMRDGKDKHPSYYERTIQKTIDDLAWRPALGSLAKGRQQ